MNFQQAKKGLKKLAKGKYHCIRYELTEYNNGDLKQECSVYVDGQEWVEGYTWNEALNKMKYKCRKMPLTLEDIEEIV